MFDFGWSELLIIFVVTVLFIRPDEFLPVLRVAMGYARWVQRLLFDLRAQLNQTLRDVDLTEGMGAGNPDSEDCFHGSSLVHRQDHPVLDTVDNSRKSGSVAVDTRGSHQDPSAGVGADPSLVARADTDSGSKRGAVS